MAQRRKLIAGNWKMNGTRASLGQIQRIAEAAAKFPEIDLLVCPPALLTLGAVQAVGETGVAVGGQDCHTAASGAHTGNLSADMWADAGARYVIVGHSERRTDHGETDAIVRQKANAALGAGLIPIICLGESLGDRDAGKTLDVIRSQLKGSTPDNCPAERMVVAYEPVWAIGTGRTPTPEQVREAHGSLRQELLAHIGAQAVQIRLLYGGSVKPDNARDLVHLEDVDGALVGGASLKADDFLAIAAAAQS